MSDPKEESGGAEGATAPCAYLHCGEPGGCPVHSPGDGGAGGPVAGPASPSSTAAPCTVCNGSGHECRACGCKGCGSGTCCPLSSDALRADERAYLTQHAGKRCPRAGCEHLFAFHGNDGCLVCACSMPGFEMARSFATAKPFKASRLVYEDEILAPHVRASTASTEPAPPPVIDPDATLDPSKEIDVPGDTPLPFSRAELQALIAEELDSPSLSIEDETRARGCHYSPIPDTDDSIRAITERGAVCGAPIREPSMGTIQESLVGCPDCLKQMPDEVKRRERAAADGPHIHEGPPLTARQEAARAFATKHLTGTAWQDFAAFLTERDRLADIPAPDDGPPICAARHHAWKSEVDAHGYHYEFCSTCKRTALQIITAQEDHVRRVRRGETAVFGHTITIVLKPDGTVQGDLDDETPLWPIGTESTAESTSVDGQARSITDQACALIVRKHLDAAAEATSRRRPRQGKR